MGMECLALHALFLILHSFSQAYVELEISPRSHLTRIPHFTSVVPFLATQVLINLAI